MPLSGRHYFARRFPSLVKGSRQPQPQTFEEIAAISIYFIWFFHLQTPLIVIYFAESPG